MNTPTKSPSWEMGSRSLFSSLSAHAYLNFAAVSPPSDRVLAATQRVLTDYASKGVGAVMTWVEARDELRAKLARLIGAQAPMQTIALLPNTTAGIIACARSIRWESGDRIMVFEGEFPSNMIPWQELAAQRDVELVRISQREVFEGDGLDVIERELKQGVRLVAISAVAFQTGWAMPLEAIGELCERHGAELFVDGIQACGVVPIDVRKMRISYLACGGHKWLLGLEGAGFLYISPEALDRSIHRHLAGWLSYDEPFGFLVEGAGHLHYDKPIKHAASFLEGGATNAVGYAALDASLDVLLDLGVESIFEHVNGYLDRLEAEVVSRFGFRSVRGKTRAKQSGALSVEIWDGVELATFSELMGARGVALSTPDGYVRMAPHWPNSCDEIDRVVEAIADVERELC